MSEGTWGLVLAFDTDDTEFCRGIEAGCLYERLVHETGTVRQQVHAHNAEMVLRIAESHGRTVKTLSDTDDWLYVEFGASQGAGA